MNAARQDAGDRCLVVATILRPPYNGVTVDGMNAAIQRFALDNPGVQLVDWYGVATSTPRDPLRRRRARAPRGLCAARPAAGRAVRGCAGGGRAAAWWPVSPRRAAP